LIIKIWGSIGDDKYLREVNPSIPRFFNAKSAMKLGLYYITGLLPFIPLEQAVFSIPKYTINYEKWHRNLKKPYPGLR